MGYCYLTPAQLNRKRLALEEKYGKPYVILQASNGEVAIVSKEYRDSCMKGIYNHA